MASNPLFILKKSLFFLHFPNELCYGYLRFGEGWLLTEFFWKIQRKTWYSILGLDAMPLSLKNLLLNGNTTEIEGEQKKVH